MGCAFNKQARVNSTLGQECDNLINLNLLLLRSLQLIYIEDKKINVSIYLIFLQKRTEAYYSLLKKYRQCWQAQITNKLPEVIYCKHLFKFEQMQSTEKEQLLNCNLILTQTLFEVRPGWCQDFANLSEFLASLESNLGLLKVFESLCKDFSDVSEKVLVKEIKRYGKFLDWEKRILDGIVKVTLGYYSEPMKMVYYRESFEYQEEENGKAVGREVRTDGGRLRKLESFRIIYSDSSSEASGDSFNYSEED
jgi:hypothetical protein